MTPREIADQLERLIAAEDFATSSAELVDQWTSLNVGSEAVEPILRFTEEHPSVELGMPGALVHFAEKFYGHGYEEKLLESISRRPTRHTVWMLNRVINGAKVPAKKQQFVAAMVRAKSHALVDPNALDQIIRFLERLGCSGLQG
jgi:hypothetical protein